MASLKGRTFQSMAHFETIQISPSPLTTAVIAKVFGSDSSHFLLSLLLGPVYSSSFSLASFASSIHLAGNAPWPTHIKHVLLMKHANLFSMMASVPSSSNSFAAPSSPFVAKGVHGSAWKKNLVFFPL